MVTLPADMVKIVWTFGYTNGTTDIEFAEPGLWLFCDGAPGSDPSLNAFCQALATQAWNAWATNMPETDHTAVVNLRQVKASHYLTSGHVDAVGQVSSGSTSWAGSSSGSCLPWQTSLVISPYAYEPGSFTANARSRRGRFYCPVPAASVLDSGQQGIYDSTKLTAQLAAFKDMIGDLTATLHGVSPVCQILSGKLGDAADVTWLAADTRLDVQRRRARSEVEPRHTLSL